MNRRRPGFTARNGRFDRLALKPIDRVDFEAEFRYALKLRQALDELGRELEQSRRIYDETLDNGSGGRAGAKHALTAVTDFLLASRINPLVRLAVQMPLRALAIALEDLDRGAVAPILQKVASDNRPRSAHAEMLRDNAAAATELLRRSGLSLSRASDFVALRLTEAGYRKSGRLDNAEITGATVRGWHRLRREHTGDEIGEFYAALVAVTEQDPTSHAATAEMILAFLEEHRPPAKTR